jgi:transcriptional regulator
LAASQFYRSWDAAGMSTDRLLYAPEHFAAADPASIVRSYPFALLITPSPSGVLATNMPLFFETDSSEATLVGHLARKNPQAAALTAGQSALAVFSRQVA